MPYFSTPSTHAERVFFGEAAPICADEPPAISSEMKDRALGVYRSAFLHTIGGDWDEKDQAGWLAIEAAFRHEADCVQLDLLQYAQEAMEEV